jgi:hypothetical protein
MVSQSPLLLSCFLSLFSQNFAGLALKLFISFIRPESETLKLLVNCFSYGLIPCFLELIPICLHFLRNEKSQLSGSDTVKSFVLILLTTGFFSQKASDLLPVFATYAFSYVYFNEMKEIQIKKDTVHQIQEENSAYLNRVENASKRSNSLISNSSGASGLRRSSTILGKLKSIRSRSGSGVFSFTENSEQDSPKSSKSFLDSKNSLSSDEDSGSNSGPSQEPQLIPGLSNDELKEILNALISQEYLIWNPSKSAENEVDLLAIALEAQNIFTQKIENLPGSSRKTMKISTKPQLRHIRSMMEVSEPLTEVLESIGEWDFNCFDLLRVTKDPAFEVGLYIFNTLGLCDRFSIENITIRKFLTLVENGYYRQNFYHNSLHAADVTASTLFLIQKGLSRCGNLVDLDVFALVFAAICHDIGHPGLNNSFLVATGHELALKYNDQSCLENMHANRAFSIIQSEGSRLTSNLTKADYQRFRKLALNAILSTDLQVHFSKLTEFRGNLDKKLDFSDEKFRSLALQISLKCADIGHGAKKLEIHIDWTNLITKEFFNQGDSEKKAGIPVSPLCDRASCVVSKSQVGFLEVLVTPLFKAWEEFIENNNEQDEELEIRVCLENVKENIEFWNEEFSCLQQGKDCFQIDDRGPPLLV